jgi:hypothetical protein
MRDFIAGILHVIIIMISSHLGVGAEPDVPPANGGIAYNSNVEYNGEFGTTVLEMPCDKTVMTAPGWEERGVEFRKWLAPSVRIGGGSGTMCYYDPVENWMYVISCGHLFSRGHKTKEQYLENRKTMTVEVFYHNNKKLDAVMKYEAEVLAHVWGNDDSSIFDVSLMRFRPNWKDPWYLPIAAKDFKYVRGQMYHSCGCDGRSEVAHYLIEFVEERANGNITEIVTLKNGPRGGRSGGGVFTDDGQLVAICSRGSGEYGYWTSLKQIHKFIQDEGFEFLIVGAGLARQIPVVDINGSGRNFPPDYIPVPMNIGEMLPSESFLFPAR